MTLELITPKESFEKLVKSGFKLIKLNDSLIPINEGWNKQGFVYETNFDENQNYGIVGGSIHKDKFGNTGKLMLVDFDIKEKYFDENNKKRVRVIPEAKSTLDSITPDLIQRDYYSAETKTGGFHSGILVSENIGQGVSLYSHQNCKDLRIDTRTEQGYVVTIAKGYNIIKIPKVFDKVISDFESFMFSFGFASTTPNNSNNSSGGLPDYYRGKARLILDTLDIKDFEELGTEKVGTHDAIVFWASSCKGRNIPLEQTREKIMCILNQFETSKNTLATEREIEKIYGNDYPNFTTKSENESNKKQKPLQIDIEKIAERIMADYNFITIEGKRSQPILFYNDGIYKDFGELVISKRSRKIQKGIKLGHINEIKGYIRDYTGYRKFDEFDKDAHIINLKNVLVNLQTGETKEHTPDYLSRVKIPVYYNPDAKCPRFDKFLSDSLENDEEKIQTVLEMMALCFMKNNKTVEKAFMHTGKGSNGKSVLFGIIVSMLGKENISAKTIHDFESNTFASSSLENKLANICADVGNKGISHTEKLKEIISGDPMTCERKYNDPYMFQPYSTLIFSANDIPEVTDDSDGFARRLELIEWEKSFYGKDRDHSVNTIQNDPEEISGIFNKLIPIAKKLLQTHALTYESTVEDSRQKWLRKSDSTQRFIDEMCTLGTEHSCSVAVLYGNYVQFAKSLGMTPLNNRKFNTKLESLKLSRDQKKSDGVVMKIWSGITLSSSLRDDKQSELV